MLDGGSVGWSLRGVNATADSHWIRNSSMSAIIMKRNSLPMALWPHHRNLLSVSTATRKAELYRGWVCVSQEWHLVGGTGKSLLIVMWPWSSVKDSTWPNSCSRTTITINPLTTKCVSVKVPFPMQLEKFSIDWANHMTRN